MRKIPLARRAARFLIIQRGKWKYRYHVLFIPTYKCNYACPYCGVRSLEQKHKSVDASKWLQWFNSLPPSAIDITGGEPFLYPGWRHLIREFPEKHRLGLTTNLSYPIPSQSDFPWKRFKNLSVSFHPYMVTLDRFMRCLKSLILFGGAENVTVNIVAYPEQLPKIPEYVKEIREVARVHVDPFISDTYQYSEKEKREVALIRSSLGNLSTRKLGQDLSEEGVAKTCNAGQKYFLVLPDGSSYTCMGGVFSSSKDFYYMGNVFEKGWKPRSKPVICYQSCSAGCDLDWVKYKTGMRKFDPLVRLMREV